MGWIVAIVLLIAGLIIKSEMFILAAGLFAIAGSIFFAAAVLKPSKSENKNTKTKTE